MCFYNDCDWYAEVVTTTEKKLTYRMMCDECRRAHDVGDTLKIHEMQEYEDCHRCYEGECCQCAEPDYGEFASYNQCEDCEKFLAAVGAAEVEAGCGSDESLPVPTEMKEAIQEGGKEEAEKYWVKAKAMYPQLIESGYLDWLWGDIFGHDDSSP